MLVELVATGLAAEAMKQKLKAEVTKGQAEECLPYLQPQSRVSSGLTEGPSCQHCGLPHHPCCTYKIVHGQWHIF